MLITDDFIMLNIPKTASTFARKVIKQVYRGENEGKVTKGFRKLGLELSSVKEILLPDVRISYYNKVDQHGIVDQIPKKYLNSEREIISIIRNPFSAWVSRYTYESWKKHPNPDWKEIKEKRFPNYPNLTFHEYIEFTDFNKKYSIGDINLRKGVELGGLSIQFIQMFCKNHKEALKNIDYDFLESGFYEEYFPKITFLKTENINEELYTFLSSIGVQKEKLSFILKEKKIKVSNKRPWSDFIDEKSKKRIIEQEWVLFKLFPEYLKSID